VNGPLVLVTSVGRASGSRAAAAALACAGSDPDRAGLLVEIGGRPPRPTLLASPGARELEERLAAHLPQVRAAARGHACHLAVKADPVDFETVRAALPLVRDSVAVVHVAPEQLRDLLGEPGIVPTAVLLRADLTEDRALTALAVRELAAHGLRVRVFKRPLAWVPSRRAMFGVLPVDAPGGLSSRLAAGILEKRNSAEGGRYDEFDDRRIDAGGIAREERRDHPSAR
jgi:hypothetical protein